MKQNEWVLNVNRCPCCGGVAELELKVPEYGWTGVRIKCIRCGLSTSTSSISEMRDTETGGIYTPITENSIIKAIKEVSAKWNRREKGEDYEKEENPA